MYKTLDKPVASLSWRRPKIIGTWVAIQVKMYYALE